MADSMVNQWVQLVSWARIGASTTAVALRLAFYADRDGTRVFPGRARLSLDCEVSPATVKRALTKLRKLGLIERVGRRPRTLVTEYRLVLVPLHELRERVEVPWVHEYDAMIAARNKADRRPDWRRIRAGHPRPAQSNVRVTSGANVRVTSDGGPTRGTHQLDPPLPSKTNPSIVTAVTREPGDDGMALEDEDHREFNGTCPACGVLLDPGRICGNRTCTDYRRTTP